MYFHKTKVVNVFQFCDSCGPTPVTHLEDLSVQHGELQIHILLLNTSNKKSSQRVDLPSPLGNNRATASREISSTKCLARQTAEMQPDSRKRHSHFPAVFSIEQVGRHRGQTFYGNSLAYLTPLTPLTPHTHSFVQPALPTLSLSLPTPHTQPFPLPPDQNRTGQSRQH